MNFFVVLQQMLALFAMIFIGFYAYKVHWVTQDTSDRLSKLLVNILNPALLINGVLDKTVVARKDLLLENLFYIFLYFVLLIGLSFPIAKVLRVGKYGGKTEEEDICSKGVLMTTLFSIITIPIVVLFL